MKLKQCSCRACRNGRKCKVSQRIIKAKKHAHRRDVRIGLRQGKDETQIDKVCAIPYLD